MKNTKIINLFGPPGVGKSTGAAYIFSQLKMVDKDCELVTEFAKDKVWEKNKKVFESQLYMLGKQAFKIARVFKEVEYIVTDSPIFLPALYSKETYVQKAAIKEFLKYEDSNINFLLKRVKVYNPNGRNETLEESDKLGERIEKFLKDNNIKFEYMNGSIEGYNQILEKIIKI